MFPVYCFQLPLDVYGLNAVLHIPSICIGSYVLDFGFQTTTEKMEEKLETASPSPDWLETAPSSFVIYDQKGAAAEQPDRYPDRQLDCCFHFRVTFLEDRNSIVNFPFPVRAPIPANLTGNSDGSNLPCRCPS